MSPEQCRLGRLHVMLSDQERQIRAGRFSIRTSEKGRAGFDTPDYLEWLARRQAQVELAEQAADDLRWALRIVGEVLKDRGAKGDAAKAANA